MVRDTDGEAVDMATKAGTAVVTADVVSTGDDVTQTVTLPALPDGLLTMQERRQAVLQARGHALPAADYALWAFLLGTLVAWVPFLAGSRPDIDATLQWQLAAIPLALGVRWLVDLVNRMAAQNALSVLRSDLSVRQELSSAQWHEYIRRETALSMDGHQMDGHQMDGR